MRPFSINLEPSIAEIIEQNAKAQGIKVARYIRSLIEKGLLVDKQLHSENPPSLKDNSKTHFEMSMAEMQVATYALLKKYGEAILGSPEAARIEAATAQQK